MTDHPLTETAVAALWDAHRSPIALPFHGQSHDYVRDQTAMLRAAFDAGREHERAQADPHHDPRSWQDCTREDIREGDLVEARDDDLLYVGIAHHQDADGDWWTEDGYMLARGDRWPFRRIPAPTPPAEEVALPTEHPAHITDVEHTGGIVCAYMALDNAGDWCGVSTQGLFCDWSPHELAAFTLPDGTRARRDGKREDGTPRFVKAQEGEK